LVVLAGGLGQRFGGTKQLAAIGPDGEAMLDYSVRDARAAGCGRIVIVVESRIEGAMADHVRRWPAGVAADVVLAVQDRDWRALEAARSGRTTPLGTAHAVVAAIEAATIAEPFAVVNADDLYGTEPYRLLVSHFAAGGEGALVGFEVGKTLLSPDPVNRAVCETDGDGWLRAIHEGVVVRHAGQLGWTGATGERRLLVDDELVSMNCWGFLSSVDAVLAEAVERFVASDQVATGAEVLLPDVVGALVARHSACRVAVLPTSGRCVGVTHADDVERLRPLLSPISW
jgi:hypothetical protein